MATFTTQEGDTVDLIAWRRFGRTRDATEAILRVNPGLAALGPSLPAGVVVVLPDTVTKTELDVPRIWS